MSWLFNIFGLFFKPLDPDPKHWVHPILKIVLVQNTKHGRELNKFCPSNRSDDLYLCFCLYPSSMGTTQPGTEIAGYPATFKTGYNILPDTRSKKMRDYPAWSPFWISFTDQRMFKGKINSVGVKIKNSFAYFFITASVQKSFIRFGFYILFRLNLSEIWRDTLYLPGHIALTCPKRRGCSTDLPRAKRL